MGALPDPDARFERPPSPWKLEDLIALKSADLFERIFVDRLGSFLSGFPSEARSTEWSADQGDPSQEIARAMTFVSAILFGALLNTDAWNSFLRAAGCPVIDYRNLRPDIISEEKPILVADRIWMTFSLPTEAGGIRTRRWVADPLTHLLLIKFQSNRERRLYPAKVPTHDHTYELRSRVKEPSNEKDDVYYIARAFGMIHREYDELVDLKNALNAAAITKWRARMPGLLIDNITKEGPSTELPESDWMRLIGGRFVTPDLVKKPATRRASYEDRPRSLNLLLEALPKDRASRPREFEQSASKLVDLSRTNSLRAAERLVLQWASARISPQSDARQTRKRLAPSTVRKRAAFLMRLLLAAFGDADPWQYEPEQFAKKLNQAIKDVGSNKDLPDHIACFLDWQARATDSLAFEVEATPKQASPSPAAGIVTAKEYLELRDRFSSASPDDACARILVELGFRAGLRWSEAIHLKIDDIRISDVALELSIRDNKARRTKTSASRRIIPLHCLLEEDECSELRRYWTKRSLETRAANVESGSEYECWLFPTADPALVSRLKKRIELELKNLTGNKRKDFHQLRHSFASYLIATLSLPSDVPDEEIVLPIDKSVVSHERRKRIARTLLGEGRLGQNAVHAVGALLGHSGEVSTLGSYFHLHDWLAGNYTSRPDAMRALPLELSAKLLGMTPTGVRRAGARKRKFSTDAEPIRRRPGRPQEGSTALGSIDLRGLTQNAGVASTDASTERKVQRFSPANSEPDWKILAAFAGASCREERDLIRDHPDLANRYGQELIRQLEVMLRTPKRGRKGKRTFRFIETKIESRRRSSPRLSHTESAVLASLYKGFEKVEPERMERVCSAFLNGYDRCRGYIAVPSDASETFNAALRIAGVPRENISLEQHPRTVRVRLGDGHKMHRGYVWGILFACAAHRAHRSIISMT